MLKLKTIVLNNQEPLIFDPNGTFVYGPNNVGKTILFLIIDYLLGSSSHDNIWELQGMENVTSLECSILIDDSKCLFLKRTINKELFYKYSNDDNYFRVDITEYKNKIQNCFSIFDKNLVENYKEFVGDNLSYRSITYLNKIDQYSIGDSTNIIPESKDLAQFKRIREQTTFLFNKDILSKQKKLLEKNRELDETINFYREHELKKEYALHGIKKEFEYLSLAYSDDMDYNKKIIENFKKGISIEKNKKGETEVLYLAKAISLVESRINVEKTLKGQTEKIGTNNQKIKSILDVFRGILGSSDKYQEYCRSIENTILEITTREEIMSVKDFDKSIDNLTKEKTKLIRRMELVRKNLTDKTYLDYSNSLNSIENYFSMIDKVLDLQEYKKALQEKEKCKTELDDLKSGIRKIESDFINKKTTDRYLNMPESLSFVIEDKKEQTIIKYNPTNKSLKGLQYNNKTNNWENYIPGSKARQTCWQICTYLSLHEYIRQNFINFPLLPILVIDGFNEPFDDQKDKLLSVYTYFKDECNKLGIQLIVLSTEKIDIQDGLIDISTGLNKEHC